MEYFNNGQWGGDMKLVPKGYNEFNPVLVLMGVFFIVAGGYGLAIMGGSGPAIVWLLRGIPAVFLAIGAIMVIKQIQLWRRRKSLERLSR